MRDIGNEKDLNRRYATIEMLMDFETGSTKAYCKICHNSGYKGNTRFHILSEHPDDVRKIGYLIEAVVDCYVQL